MEFKLTGIDQAIRALRSAASSIPEISGEALEAEARVETAKVIERTPYLTGALRGSVKMHPAEIHGGEISVRITAGGPEAPHGLVVHERLDVHHAAGEPKFLESTMLQSIPTLGQRLAKRIGPAFAGRMRNGR